MINKNQYLATASTLVSGISLEVYTKEMSRYIGIFSAGKLYPTFYSTPPKLHPEYHNPLI